MFVSILVSVLFACAIVPSEGPAKTSQPANGVYQRWNKGLSSDPNFFPIAVWLQAPRNAKRFQEAGINLYVGLWQGPTEQQLAELKAVGMPVICDQNQVGLTSQNADVIVGWMHGDEPDNAQARRDGNGYDPPILPSKIEADYQQIQAARRVTTSAPEPRPGRRLRPVYRPRRADEIIQRTTPSMSKVATLSRSISTRQSTIMKRSPASSSLSRRGSNASAAGPTTRRSSGTASSAAALATRGSNPLRNRSGPRSGCR